MGAVTVPAMTAPTAPSPIILGLAGYLRSGKDETGRALVADGFVQFSPADKIREFLYALNPQIVQNNITYRLASLVDSYGWERCKEAFPETRVLQQRCGKQAGRDVLYDDVWVDAVMRDLPAGRDLLNTSVRFPNEAEAIRSRGGYVIRIERPGFAPGEGAHESETAMDGYPYDFTVHNAGSIAELHDGIRAVVATIRSMHAKAAQPAT